MTPEMMKPHIKHSVSGISVDGVMFDSHLRRGSLERAAGTESEQTRSESDVFSGAHRTRSHRIRSDSTGPSYMATSEPAENACFHAGNATSPKGCLVRLLCIAIHHRHLGGPFWGPFLVRFRSRRGLASRNIDFQKHYKTQRIFNIFRLARGAFRANFGPKRPPGGTFFGVPFRGPFLNRF